jgi:glycosyltransferase involved in cell wall biosynthesis
MDVDDAIWEIQEDNHAYEVYKKGSESLRNFTVICNEVDYITCTNQYLKHVICDNTRQHPTRVKVFPNYIDLSLYNHRCKFKDTHEIVLMHHGSTTHFIDLQEEEFAKGIDRIMREYPNVVLKTVGAMIPQYKKRWGRRYINDFGDQDIYKWIQEKFPGFHDDADILVVPLKKSVYTRCKSSIKFLETSSAGIPGVYQRIRQYEEVVIGNNGFLADTAQEWYLGIKLLIDNKELRRSMGQEAFKTVEESWQIQQHVKDYADFFKNLTK